MICSISFRTLFTAGPLGKYLNKTKHSVYNFAVLFPLCYVYVLRFWKNRCARICDLTLLCRCGKSILNVSIATRVLSKSLSNASVKQSRQTSKQASLAVAVSHRRAKFMFAVTQGYCESDSDRRCQCQYIVINCQQQNSYL